MISGDTHFDNWCKQPHVVEQSLETAQDFWGSKHLKKIRVQNHLRPTQRWGLIEEELDTQKKMNHLSVFLPFWSAWSTLLLHWFLFWYLQTFLHLVNLQHTVLTTTRLNNFTRSCASHLQRYDVRAPYMVEARCYVFNVVVSQIAIVYIPARSREAGSTRGNIFHFFYCVGSQRPAVCQMRVSVLTLRHSRVFK